MGPDGANFAGPGLSGKYQRLIDERLQKAAEPLQRLQGEQQSVQDRQQLVRKLNGALADLRDTASRLGDAGTFRARRAASDTPEAVSARAEGTADPGRHRITVEHPASSHVHLAGVRSSNREQPAGVSDPDDPAQLQTGSAVSFHHNGAAHRYAVDGETSLADLAQQIEADDNGVSARAANLGTVGDPQHVLRLAADASGAGARIRRDAAGEAGIAVTGPHGEPGALFSAGPLQQQVAQPGRDARFTVDGTPLERASNTVTDALPGVALDLRSATEGPVTVSVERNGAEASQAVRQFVERFNAVAGLLDQATRYDPESGEAGPLHGDSLARQASDHLREPFGQRLASLEGNAYQDPGDVGLALQRDGRLALDSGRLERALQEDGPAVARLFAGDNGLAQRLEASLAGLTSRSDGMIQARLDTLEARLDRLDGEVRREREDLREQEGRLKERFAELEKAMAGLEGRRNAVQQAMDRIPAAGNGN